MWRDMKLSRIAMAIATSKLAEVWIFVGSQFRTILCVVSRAGTANAANIYHLALRCKRVFL